MTADAPAGPAPVVVIGGGGHAAVVADAIGTRLVGHIAPAPGDQQVCGPWLGTDDQIEELDERGCVFAIGIGSVDTPSTAERRRILRSVREESLAIVVHPGAIVAATARLAAGVFVGAGAVVGVRATVGVGSIVNSNGTVDHDCVVGTNVHIAPGVAISGGVRIGDDSLIGIGSSIRQGVTVGAAAIVGAGAVVVADVPDGATVVGVPARSLI